MQLINDHLMNDTINTLKATIISHRGGILAKKINNEFRQFAGMDIPYKQLEFECLIDFLRHVPGLKLSRNSNGEMNITVVASRSAHIQNLVENQKDKKVKDTFNRNQLKKVNFKNVKKNGSRFRRNRSNSTGSRGSSYDYRSDSGSDDFGSYSSKSSSRQSSINIRIDPFRTRKIETEPHAYGQQLIGDDFFLQLAIRNLNVDNLWRKHDKDAIRSGLCVSGQTIRDCINRLSKLDAISNRVVIMLGAVDIYNGNSEAQMTSDLDELLELCEKKFLLSKSAITLCTIPPLANIPMFTDFDRLSAMSGYNIHIRDLVEQYHYGYLDFQHEFYHIDESRGQYSINFNLFQVEARMVSGCRHPHVLWNRKGRTKAMNLLRKASQGIQSELYPSYDADQVASAPEFDF